MQGWREHLSYSNVIATLALFVALGGGAWALSKNSVGSREIEKGGVRSSEIENGTVKGKDVKEETLGAGEIADGSIGAAELGDGAVGSGELADGSVESSKIPNNAVAASEIAGSAVGSSEIAANAVGSGKVINGSLTGGDVAANSLTGAQIDESSLGIVSDAATLGGRSFVYGEAESADADVDVIATLPALGAELRDDGTADNDLEVVLANTGSFAKVDLACPNGTASAGPGLTDATGAPVDTMMCLAFNAGDPTGPSRSLIFCVRDTRSVLIRCEVLQTS